MDILILHCGVYFQMVIASKVKARSDSNNLINLKSSSKVVAEATAQVIATCRTINSAEDEKEKTDFSTLSVHQSKRLEINHKKDDTK